MCADGGDGGNDRNRLWINQGGAQGGTLRVFADMTQAQYPAVSDTSRDVDFADIDGDGDPDVVVTNESTFANQSNRILVNQGGLQGGTAGFFVNETSSRWVNVGVNDGVTTFSSVAPSLVLPSGGFVDWSGDMLFADLDNDGDLDMLHSSYGDPIGGAFTGDIPHRIFLNDGLGFFEEHNPSGVQLVAEQIPEGTPALWASGVHQQNTLSTNGAASDIASTAIGVEVGDLDGDFDLDLLLGARDEQPRLFRNELSGSQLLPFVDVTHAAFTELAVPRDNYEQELGDFDGDNDLDIYGVNWAGSFTMFQVRDALLLNEGGFTFGPLIEIAGSDSDNEEADFIDYDGDGDLDVFVANFSGQDQLYENLGGSTVTEVTSELPSLTMVHRGVDSADVDEDGDPDLLVAVDNKKENRLVVNVTQVADTHAPRIVLEQVGPPSCGQESVTVRAAVYDNASWERMRYNATEIEYTLASVGTPQTAPMSFSGGQIWRGEIPAVGADTVFYRVRSTDRAGNAGVSPTLSYVVPPAYTSYCTAGTSASGCQALLSTSGTPSASAPSGFFVQAGGVEGSKNGLFYWSTNGQIANAWGNGTSWNCVALPAFRSAPLVGVGTNGACDGSFSYDLNVRWQQKPASNPGSGAVTQVQLWYRDPQNTSNQTTSLSDAVEFTVCP